MQILIMLLLSCAGVKTPAFKAQTIDNNVAIGYGLAIGDVDGDGKPDIILADKKHFVWYRNGDWKRFVLAENLTAHDNVCITAEDIDGDGKVEIAVGAQWNPGETADYSQSGAVFYLKRPADPTTLWTPIKLPHEPTTHRMQWAKAADGNAYLIVVPLHGVGNKNGNGKGVKVIAYKYPQHGNEEWKMVTLDSSMHLTHNLELAKRDMKPGVFIGGKEGVRFIGNNFVDPSSSPVPGLNYPVGELKIGTKNDGGYFMATIEPMHGQKVVVYNLNSESNRQVLDSSLVEGHALGTADLLGLGYDQVVAGWRNPNHEGKVGVKLYYRPSVKKNEWTSFVVDDNTMACEDLKIADLNGDGKPEIIAAGRATKNLKIYWNEN